MDAICLSSKPTAAQRVQTLFESGSFQIPSHYIQPPELRPNPNPRGGGGGGGIPVVDLADQSSSAALPAVCREWGAFQVINHGVPAELLDEMRSSGLRFFETFSMEEKARYACDPTAPASEGYGSKMLAVKEDTVLDWRDYFDHHTLPESRRNPNRWPHSPASYRNTVMEYSNRMEVLAQRLLGMISESLDLPPNYIEEAIGEVYQNITISYYPPCPQPDLALGLQAHSDIGVISLLIQDDVGGLEVLKDGEWVLAQPISVAIIVILADQTEIISNGEYKSSVHRALVNAQRSRVSVATFHDPSKTRKISPAPQLITKQSPQKYREVVYGDYVSSWYGKGPEGRRNLDALLMVQQ